MPLTTSAIQALRNSTRKAEQNAKIRHSYKEILKKTRKSPTAENLAKAFSILDKASRENVIHQNKAARLKSRLAKLASKKGPVETKPVKKAVKKTTKKATSKTAKKTSEK
jgi:small subunit ribosomal protein S20